VAISRSDSLLIIKSVLEKQRLVIAAVEAAGEVDIVRFSAPNGAVIGSIAISPHARENSPQEALRHLTNLVIESGRAATKEPATKQSAEEASRGLPQKASLEVVTAGRTSAPKESLRGRS
jgi:hypothetical protein